MMMTAIPDTPIGRYARILEALAGRQDGLTLSQIAEATDLPAAAVHRLLKSLRSVNFVVQREDRKAYVLGPRIHRLFQLSVTAPSVMTAARPLLHELVLAFGETAFLAKLIGMEVESIAMETPSEGSRAFVQPGRVMPMHAAASAKAILAFQDAEFIDRILAHPRKRFTADTKIEDADIRRELADIRRQCFAVCDNELDPGVLSYAAPVALDGKDVIYAIGINGLSERLREHPVEAVRSHLQAAANSLASTVSLKELSSSLHVERIGDRSN